MAINQSREDTWTEMLSQSFPGQSFSDEEESVLTDMAEEEDDDVEDREPTPREDPAPTIATVKDQEMELGELKKENFGLKLRIYHLEEGVCKKFGARDEWQTSLLNSMEVRLGKKAKHSLVKEKKSAGTKSVGEWSKMAAPIITPSLRRDLKVLRMRNALHPAHHYKASDMRKKFPRHFHVGRVVADPSDFYNRIHRKAQKQTLVDELLAC